MKRLAVCVGINDYPGSGSDLNGCVNDALDWSTLLRGLGYEVVTIRDGDATKGNVMEALNKMVFDARYRDQIVFTFSGHGSWVPDGDGDEADGRDEVLLTHDYRAGGYITDDDVNRIFSDRRYGVKPMLFIDACHSGTVSRFAGLQPELPLEEEPVEKRARYLGPEHFLDAQQVLAAERVQDLPAKGISRPTTALISGCDDSEFSYDAYIGGRYRGAFTAAAMATYTPGITLKTWHAAIRRVLPSVAFRQTPQISATYNQNRWSI